MREISFEQVAEAVSDLCVQACYELSDEMIAALERARQAESDAQAAERLGQLLENARIGATERIPLCQDTGFAVVFVEQGEACCVVGTGDKGRGALAEAIDEGVRRGYAAGLLRQSIVAEPLGERVNTQTNTPAVIHYQPVAGDRLGITLMAKGGGCENRSALKLFKPTAAAAEVEDFVVEVARNAGADACPPLVVGVGMGGTFEKCCELAKRALLRKLDSHHGDGFYAAMEQRVLERINGLGIGPGGLGGDITALAVLIETHPCHIASLPVAVNIECHAHRHKSVTL